MIFSVVIPVYNVKDYLPKCIDSVLAQDFEDYEVILIDDGSTDGESGEICDRYAAAHPLCEMCLKEGRLTPVEEVHHIVPLSQGGTHRNDNLMSLCQSCHTKIHHELGDR